MATAREENPYEGGTAGFGTGGKFRKRPFRRSQTTPYDRPPTALRNPNRNSNGWFSKLVDPAQRLIASSAHRLFSSVFRKRLPPPPPPHPPSSEAEQEVRGNNQGSSVFVANGSSGKKQGTVGENDVQINYSDGTGLPELEKLLKQKTFTRSEIDHLTALMRSRTVDSPVMEDEKRTEVVPSEPMLSHEQKDECPKTPALENGIENRLACPYVTSSVPIEDVASPAELAKAYMGSRPSKVSPSGLALRSSAPREDPILLKSQHFAPKSPVMSIMPRATSHAGVHENGFVTPRSLGRSAIYSMARTPYARVYPSSTHKGAELAVEGEPSSSAQYALDRGMLSVSRQEAWKRRSSVLDNDIGSVGPIRRIRHKSNLLSSKGLTLPVSGSRLSIARSGVGTDATQKPSSSMQKPMLGDVKLGHMKLSTENVEGTMPSTSYPPLPSKSSETASKILQQLDKLVSPKEKSSQLRLPTVNDKSPTKLSSSMLSGQALRSMETVDSSKFLDDIRDNELDGPLGNFPDSAQKFTSQTDKVENGTLKLVAPADGLVPIATDANATFSRKQVVSNAKSGESPMMKSVSYPPQKKRAFHMSAHEDYLDLDDDVYPNGAISSVSTAEKETTRSTAVEEKTTSATETNAQENSASLSVLMPSKSFTDGKTHVETADGAMVGKKINVSTSITSSIPVPTSKPISKPVTVANTAAVQTFFGSDKSASPNGSIANPPLFNFGNKVVSSTEFTAADGPQKESSKLGPIFGLEQVVSSKVPVADASLVNFGTKTDAEKVPQVPFTFSSSVGGESAGLKFSDSSDPKLRSSISSTTAVGAIDSIPKALESENADAKTNLVTGFSFKSSESAVSSSASTSLSTSSTNILTFGHSSNQTNGPVASNPSFSSPFPPIVTNNFTSQNMFSNSSLPATNSVSATAASNSTSMTTNTPAVTATSTGSSSTPAVVSSSPSTSFFKFGSSPFPSTSLPVSSTSGSEPVETKSKQDAGIGNLGSNSFGSSSAAVGSTGSGIFGFSSSAATTVNNQSQDSPFGSTSGSVLGGPVPPFTSAFATSTHSQTVAFGSSVSSPSFGLNGNTSFSSGSSLFPSSSPATNIFNSGSTFGQSTSASSSEANSVGSNSGTSSTFGLSSWQPSKSPFGSAFSSSSSSGFSFGTTTPVTSTSSPMMFGSSISASTSPQFSFTSTAATTSMQPAFGNPSRVFTFGSTASVNNDQMSMEDSMAEDTVQATAPVTPVFGQQPAPLQSNYAFGASTPTGASPFQFASQQNVAPQNPSPFQASGSLEFNAGGGSFSLGTGGGDKSGRKFVKVKHKQRKKQDYGL